MLCAKAKTRRNLYGCSGVFRTPTAQVCRAGGLEPYESVCQRHFDKIRREDDKTCSCPSTWGHSGKLHSHPIPTRYYTFLDHVGRTYDSYKPGTRWCNKCRTEAPTKLKNWLRPEEEFACERRRENSATEVQGCEAETDADFHGATHNVYQEVCQETEAMESETGQGSNQDRITGVGLSTEPEPQSMQQDPHYWKIAEGQFGEMLVGQDGDVMLEASTWKSIQKKINEPTFKELLDTLSRRMDKCSDRQRLVSQPVFKEFLLSTAPTLYKNIIDSILSERHGDKRANLQEKRATALIWQLLYYRNQRHGELMDESSIFLELHGLSSSGMALGKVLGFARDEKTKTHKRHNIASDHLKMAKEMACQAIKRKSFQILSMDDFHNIHAVKTPTERILTNAVHMATLLLDIQPSVYAVPHPVNPANIHRSVMVTMPGGAPQICRGGISTNAVIREITTFWPNYSGNFFLESLPQPYKEIDPCTMKQSLKELRVYSREDQEECQTLKSTILIDEIEQNLHSKDDYQACHQYVFDVIPEFKEFLKLHVAGTYSGRLANMVPSEKDHLSC